MLNRILLLIALLAIVSCKAKKQLVRANKTDDTVSVKAMPPVADKINSIRAAQLQFNTFSAKAKAELSLGASSNNVSLTVRIDKGKKIWVSITAIAGIEVARALITPDSIEVINKLQGLYLAKPFSYLYKYTGDKIDYNAIEALLVGNAIPQLLNNDAQLRTDSAGLKISGILNELGYNLAVGPDMHVIQTHLTNTAAGQALDVLNSQPMQVLDRSMSSQIDINSVAGAKKVKINIHYNKVDFDKPLEFPFNIPAGYEPAK